MTFTDLVEVVPGLYVGSHPEPDDPFDLGAGVVVSLTPNTTARSVPRNGVLVHWPIKDGPVPPPDLLDSIAGLVATCLSAGTAVFIHCRAGMNRSVLLAARVLMIQGMSADEAIDVVRARRQGSLSDEYADWLRANRVQEAPR